MSNIERLGRIANMVRTDPQKGQRLIPWTELHICGTSDQSLCHDLAVAGEQREKLATEITTMDDGGVAHSERGHEVPSKNTFRTIRAKDVVGCVMDPRGLGTCRYALRCGI